MSQAREVIERLETRAEKAEARCAELEAERDRVKGLFENHVEELMSTHQDFRDMRDKFWGMRTERDTLAAQVGVLAGVLEFYADAKQSGLIMDSGQRARQALADLPASAKRIMDGSPADLRDAGWSVAVHNDYQQDGRAMTFWLFTKNGRAVKGEGYTDAAALKQVRQDIAALDRGTDG